MLPIIIAVRILSAAIRNRCVDVLLNQVLRFLSHDVLRRPGPLRPKIFPSKTVCSRPYLSSFRMIWPGYNLRTLIRFISLFSWSLEFQNLSLLPSYGFSAFSCIATCRKRWVFCCGFVKHPGFCTIKENEEDIPSQESYFNVQSDVMIFKEGAHAVKGCSGFSYALFYFLYVASVLNYNGFQIVVIINCLVAWSKNSRLPGIFCLLIIMSWVLFTLTSRPYWLL